MKLVDKKFWTLGKWLNIFSLKRPVCCEI